ncbi:D-alanyl-D-alanine carboxypeptidase/D-alanyl-D-alanine-endopeptidase [Massilia sp. W12]|uniref:D-alanyl-D-alanine carboxypeptidase/D-alanyl-D-alanine endopeptidase n=1 Tax=Massilia sp. W12 TaxID=3126507 RepID=UPI0030CA67D5
MRILPTVCHASLIILLSLAPAWAKGGQTEAGAKSAKTAKAASAGKAAAGKRAARIARASGMPTELAQALAASGLPPQAFGLAVQAVGADVSTAPRGAKRNKANKTEKAGKEQRESAWLLEFNARQSMNPASVMKLLTTHAALAEFGPQWQATTRIYGVGELQHGVWQGDVYLQGGLDPRLAQENLWQMLHELRAQGVQDVQGRILFDRSLWPQTALEDFDGASIKPYNVAPDALLFNFKSLRLYFNPDPASQSARVSAQPALPDLHFATLPLSNAACDDWQEAIGLRFERQEEGKGVRVLFDGSYPASCGVRARDVQAHAHSANPYAAGVLASLWRQVNPGSRFAVSYDNASVPPDANLLLEWASPPLALLVRDINKYSNNVMARMLYLRLGVVDGKASLEAADQRIRAHLQAKGVDLPELVLDNGSGLSRRERISPAGMVRVLQLAWRAPHMPEFIASMPLVGVDGTMRRRLLQSPAQGQAHIKTGTLKDVRSVAGYVLAQSGRRYALAAFVNHSNPESGRALLDKVIEWVQVNG